MAKKSQGIPPLTVGGTQDNAPETEPALEESAKEIQVVALEKGTYEGVRRKEGDKFTVKEKTILVNGKKVIYTAEKQIGSWMKKI